MRNIVSRIRNCGGCAQRRKKISAAYNAAKQGLQVAKTSYLRQTGQQAIPDREARVTRVVRVR